MPDSTQSRNQSYVTNDGRASTFGRTLASFIQNRLPYSNIIDTDNNTLNPKYKVFANTGLKRSEALAKNSISISNEYNNMAIGSMGKDTSFGQVMYANIQENKGARLRDYRVMAAYSDVADALDEICDETINTDEHGNEINIKYKNVDLESKDKSMLDEEFAKFAEYFDFKNRGWQYFRQLLVEGELYFELIIHKDYVDSGVLGAINLPSELIDPVYNNIQNMMIKGFVYRKPIFDPQKPDKQEKIEHIPLEQNQVIYINSGVMNETKNMVLPFLENARRAYRQLSLIEDAIVIYRLVRAPERLVFNVDVGNMAAPKAEAYLKKLISNYWSSKTFDVDQADVVKKFNPQSMLDAFWFPKRQGSEGSSVSQLAGGCFAMDTLVPLLDGRKLTLTEMAAEYVAGKENWIYSCNPDTGHIVPGLVSWAGVTHKSADVMKITLDNGKEIICTHEHKFPIIGRGFVEAKDLVVNDSLIPFNTQLAPINKTDKKASKYEQVYQNDTKEWEFTHKMVVREMQDSGIIKEEVFDDQYRNCNLRQVRHHKDFNKFNNLPSNLVWMNKRDHTALHTNASPWAILNKIKEIDPDRYKDICEKQYKKVSATNKLRCNTPEHKKIQSIRTKELWTRPEYRAQRVALNSSRWKNPVFAAKMKDGMTLKYTSEALKALIDVINEVGVCEKKYIAQYIAENPDNKFSKQFFLDNSGKNIWSKKIGPNILKVLIKAHGYKNYAAFRREFSFFNHRVVKIEHLTEPIEVGTLTIDNEEKYHNYHTFALDSGVFTRNSNLGELSDLMYFIKKLYRSLKVPTSRLDPEDAFKDGSEILREELKFARFVIRQQQRFATGIKRGFITHLKFKGLWEKLELNETNIEVEFNVPTNFYEMRESQRLEQKAANFNSIAQSEFVSKTYAQKKYLGWKDKDILANREFLRKDAELQWEISQITTLGPAWREQAIAQDIGVGEQPGAEMGGMAPGGPPQPAGAGTVPPEFTGGTANAEAPAATPGTSAPPV